MKRAWMMALATAGVCVGAMPALAQEKVQLRFATVGVGSAWHKYTNGLATLIKPKLPRGATLDMKPAAGGLASVRLIQAGEAEIGLSFANTSAEGCTGTGVFKAKQDKLRAMMGGLDTYYFGTFATRASGITSWEEIAGAKNKFWLLTTRAGGTGELAVRQVLGLLGTSVQGVVDKGGFIEATGRASTARQIKDGLADGWAHIVTKGHPAATQVSNINDTLMVPLPDYVITGMVEKHGWAEASIPPNTFKGQTEPIKTVKAATNILVAASVRDDVVYAMTKAIMDNADKLPKFHVALADFDPKRAAEPGLNGNCPMHPGAAKYYKEVGLLKK
jgi:TRAP transporter TAXI family solute receptor